MAANEDLVCVVCLDLFTDPVDLSCGHDICRLCWDDIVQHRPAPPKCPVCRAVVENPQRRQTNFALKGLAERARQERERAQQRDAAGTAAQVPGGLRLEPPRRTVSALPDIAYDELTIVKQLGSGGFGCVFLAKWNDAHVAFKEVKQGSDDDLEVFRREASMLRSLCHPNIVQFFGAATVAPHCGIVMEYMQGGSLYDHIGLRRRRNAPFSLNQAIDIALSVARGLLYLHMKDILHRDVKSLNILLDVAPLAEGDVRAKLCDFGLSRKNDPVMTMGVGSLPWMAPEMLSESNYGRAVDVYAFGIVLWEMAANKAPYEGLFPPLIIFGVKDGSLRPRITDELSRHPLVPLMQRAWAQEASDRPPFEDIIRDLDLLRRSLTQSSPVPGPAPPRPSTPEVDLFAPDRFPVSLRDPGREGVKLSSKGGSADMEVRVFGGEGRSLPVEIVVADAPVPPAARAFYFEVMLSHVSENAFFSIGLWRRGTSANTCLGFERGCYGYECTQGAVFDGPASEAVREGTVFGEGDVVGVGVSRAAKAVIFVKNGALVHRASIQGSVDDALRQLYPAVHVGGQIDEEGAGSDGEGESDEAPRDLDELLHQMLARLGGLARPSVRAVIAPNFGDRPFAASDAFLAAQLGCAPERPPSSAEMLFLVGGAFGRNQAPRLTVEHFDPLRATWGSVDSAVLSRYVSAATVVQKGRCAFVVVAGGARKGAASTAASAFDPRARRWVDLPPLNEARAIACLVSARGAVYAIGGASDGQSLASVERLELSEENPAAGAWRTLPPMKQSRSRFAACVLGDHIYAVGGLVGARSNCVTAGVERMDLATGAWTEVASMPSARAALGAVAHGGLLYAIGGRGVSGMALKTVEVYDPRRSTWATRQPMETGRRAGAYAVLGDRIYAACGHSEQQYSCKDVEAYDPARNTWTSLPATITERRKVSLVVLPRDYFPSVIAREIKVGDVIRRGPNWKWGNQDGGAGRLGKVVRVNADKWVEVKWDAGGANNYRWGAEGGQFDLEIVQSSAVAARPSQPPPAPAPAPPVQGRDVPGPSGAPAAAATPPAAPPYRHEGTGCNGCRAMPIVGIRWKCWQCAAFDLCERCETSGKKCPGAGRGHALVKIVAGPLPGNWPAAEQRKTFAFQDKEQHDALCDGCGTNKIAGVRWRCLHCRDFDFCSECEGTIGRYHDPSHLFIRLPKPLLSSFYGPMCTEPAPPAGAWPARLAPAPDGVNLNGLDGGALADVTLELGTRTAVLPADAPVPAAAAAFYFEVTVLKMNAGARVGVGFCSAGHDRSQPLPLPACPTAVGVDSAGGASTPPFGRGDTIGAGYSATNRKVLFTKNGEPLEARSLAVPAGFFPALHLAGSGDARELGDVLRQLRAALPAMLLNDLVGERVLEPQIGQGATLHLNFGDRPFVTRPGVLATHLGAEPARAALPPVALFRVGGFATRLRTFEEGVERLDIDPAAPRAGRWTRVGADLPRPVAYSVAAAASALVIAGGARRRAAASEARALDPETGQWAELPPLPAPRAIAAAAAVGRAVYVVGGLDGSGRNSARVDRFDLPGSGPAAAGRWSQGPSLAKARSRAAVCADGAVLYALGGIGDEGGAPVLLSSVEALDTAAAAWRAVAPMPTARAALSAVAVGGFVYAIGGRDGGGSPLAVVERLDVRRGTWSACPPMPRARRAAACAALGDLIVVAGGCGGRVVSSKFVDVYDTARGVWMQVGHAPSNRRSASLLALPRTFFAAAAAAGFRAAVVTAPPSRFVPNPAAGAFVAQEGGRRVRVENARERWAVVVADSPIPDGAAAVYFEVRVEELADGCAFGVGFHRAGLPLDTGALGCLPNTVGFLSPDQGTVLSGARRRAALGPFAAGDTVGAGVSFARREVVFTRGGQLVYRRTCGPEEDLTGLQPAVCLRGTADFRANFSAEPFAWEGEESLLPGPPLPDGRGLGPAALAGARVVRGEDWEYGDQDGGSGAVGLVLRAGTRPNTVIVRWPNGSDTRFYRVGGSGKSDLRLVEAAPAPAPPRTPPFAAFAHRQQPPPPPPPRPPTPPLRPAPVPPLKPFKCIMELPDGRPCPESFEEAVLLESHVQSHFW